MIKEREIRICRPVSHNQKKCKQHRKTLYTIFDKFASISVIFSWEGNRVGGSNMESLKVFFWSNFQRGIPLDFQSLCFQSMFTTAANELWYSTFCGVVNLSKYLYKRNWPLHYFCKWYQAHTSIHLCSAGLSCVSKLFPPCSKWNAP